MSKIQQILNEKGDITLYLGGPVIAGDKQEIVEVLVNEAKDLFCDVSGTEPINIEWLRDGKTIEFAGESRSATTYLQVHLFPVTFELGKLDYFCLLYLKESFLSF